MDLFSESKRTITPYENKASTKKKKNQPPHTLLEPQQHLAPLRVPFPPQELSTCQDVDYCSPATPANHKYAGVINLTTCINQKVKNANIFTPHCLNICPSPM